MFDKELPEVFSYPESGQDAKERLLSLNQDTPSTADNLLYSGCRKQMELAAINTLFQTRPKKNSNLSWYTGMTHSLSVFSESGNLVKIPSPVPETQPQW